MEGEDLERELEALHVASYAWTLTCCQGDREEASEVLQTTYLKILEGRARFRGDSSLKTWLFAVIRQTAQGRRRRSAVRRRLLRRWTRSWRDLSQAPTPEQHARRVEECVRVREALRQLSRRQREVLELVFYHDLSLRQAAEVLRVAIGTARIQYERGKRRLLTQMEKSGGPSRGR